MFRDGASYEGTWYLGRAHGYGTFTHVKGETYEGEWADDMRHGTGEMIQLNGVKFRGRWFMNGREGVGAEILSEKHTFHGTFKNGKKNAGNKIGLSPPCLCLPSQVPPQCGPNDKAGPV